MNKKILIPLDRSELAESVLPLACTLAKNSNVDIVLLHVVEYPFSLYLPCEEYPPIDPTLRNMIEEKKKTILQDGKKYLEHISTHLKKGGIRVHLEVCEGPVVESIVAAAERLYADLIVISTHGRSGNVPGLIGAVADRVLREAKIPVILIQPTQNELLPEPSFV